MDEDSSVQPLLSQDGWVAQVAARDCVLERNADSARSLCPQFCFEKRSASPPHHTAEGSQRDASFSIQDVQ